MPAFDQRDLEDTAARIRQRLDGDNEKLQLLQELLDQVQGNNEQWSEQLMELQEGQQAVAKAVMLIARNQFKAQAQLGDVQKGLAAVFRMTKAQRVPTGKPLTKSLLSKSQSTETKQAGGGMSLVAAEQLGTLAKTIRATFGGSGGHQMAYNAPLASKMILEGTLTAKQHQTWKRSNRLHDDPWQALQRRKVG